MIEKSKIEKIVNRYLKGTDHFLVNAKVKDGNKITVVLDSDTSVTVKDCISVSREVEGSFDREVEDFSLDVTSYGIANPLIMKRQYIKNIGRKVKLQLKEGKTIKGKMTEADDKGLMIEVKKPKKKKESAKSELLSFTYEEVNECKIEISF